MAIPRRSTAPPLAIPPAQQIFSSSAGYADVSELDKYKLISNIGKGSFGVISKVQRIEDGKEFALKQLDYSKMTDKDRKQILAEVAILEGLKHRNIVQLFQKIKDPKNERIYIVMEYCPSGDLGSLIRKASRAKIPIHEEKIWNVFLQITLALHHCHWPSERLKLGGRNSGGAEVTTTKYQVLHRDLKPENVFLSDDFVKLGDFGLSKDMGTAAFTDTYVGTPLYMPPEILSENRYDTKSDIWSLGCLVFEMCTFSSPFSTASTQAELIQMVKSGRLPAIPPQYSTALAGAVKAMLNLNPTKRPSTRDLLEMDEMRLHRKLFTVQKQTTILLARKAELDGYEERLRARTGNVEERERQLVMREAACAAREQNVANKENELQITQDKYNVAADALRAQWDKLRDEKDRMAAREEQDGQAGDFGDYQPRRQSVAALRPALEERHTMPVAPPRPARTLSSWEDTPSKIPVACNSGSPITASQGTPLRRNNTKSLNNLRAEARAQAAAASGWAATNDATPAKPTGLFGRPGVAGRHISGQRSSIGSPGELEKTPSPYCEDISMASPMPYGVPSPGPFLVRPRKSGVAPSQLLRQAMHTAAATGSGGGLPPSSSASSQDSMTSGDGQSSASGSGSGSGQARSGEASSTRYNVNNANSNHNPSSNNYQTSSANPNNDFNDTASSNASSNDSTGVIGKPQPQPRSQSHAPPAVHTQTYVYRAAATPAKWTMEDPDLPSPFLRRGSSAAPGSLPTVQQLQLQMPLPLPSQSSAGSGSGVPSGAGIIPNRQPLGAIQMQNTGVASTEIPHSASSGGGGLMAMLGKKSTTPVFGPGPGISVGAGQGQGPNSGQGPTGIPRSKSGTLHQQVLKTNAQAQAGGGKDKDTGSGAAGGGGMRARLAGFGIAGR